MPRKLHFLKYVFICTICKNNHVKTSYFTIGICLDAIRSWSRVPAEPGREGRQFLTVVLQGLNRRALQFRLRTHQQAPTGIQWPLERKVQLLTTCRCFQHRLQELLYFIALISTMLISSLCGAKPLQFVPFQLQACLVASLSSAKLNCSFCYCTSKHLHILKHYKLCLDIKYFSRLSFTHKIVGYLLSTRNSYGYHVDGNLGV